MAGNLAALNAYLNNTLHISDQATRDALNEQGLDSSDSFKQLTDQDIKDLGVACRKPGGTMANPNAAAANAPAIIPKPGVALSFLSVKRLRMLCYYIHHMERIQRPFHYNQATMQRLLNVWALYEDEEKNDEDPDMPEKFTDVKNVRSMLEDLDNYLIIKRGATGLPLAYVTRDEIGLPAPADDPGFGNPDATNEMIRRGDHGSVSFPQDNIQVWAVLRHICHGGPGWSWISRYARVADGRAAYNALKGHYLGEAYISRVRANADKTMETAFYDGRSRNFTYEKYCEIIEETGEEVTEERKMRTFLKGLNDPRCESAKNTIRVTTSLRNSVANAMDMVAEVLGDIASFTNPARRNVSSEATTRAPNGSARGGGRGQGRGRRGERDGRGGRGNGGGRGNSNMLRDDEIVNRYYSPHDWWNRMTDAQRTRARGLRESGRGGRSGRSTGQRNASSVSFVDPVDDGQSERNVVPRTNANASPSGSQVSMIETRRQV